MAQTRPIFADDVTTFANVRINPNFLNSRAAAALEEYEKANPSFGVMIRDPNWQVPPVFAAIMKGLFSQYPQIVDKSSWSMTMKQVDTMIYLSGPGIQVNKQLLTEFGLPFTFFTTRGIAKVKFTSSMGDQVYYLVPGSGLVVLPSKGDAEDVTAVELLPTDTQTMNMFNDKPMIGFAIQPE